MKYNFDEIVDRRNTNSIKYDFAAKRGDDILPLWVADMDFRVPCEVTDALISSAKHGIFGYTDAGAEYYNAVEKWFRENHGFHIQNEWIVKTPGVVFALSAAVRALSNEGDAVLIQPPVYHPFFDVINKNRRRVITNPLVYDNGKYYIDFADFEEKIINNRIRLFILCSPHNPVGRVWTKDELIKIGEICKKHGCIVVSDEIHCDFVYSGHRHHVFSTVSEGFSDRSLICTAPSKTFNLAGLQVSNVFIKNPEIRRVFIDEIERTGYGLLNTMGFAACRAAYESGDEWLHQLNKYLYENLAYLKDALAKALPKVTLVVPEGTYLAWLDFRGLGLSQRELDMLLLNNARVFLSTGTSFGVEGTGFQRINFACPKSVLEEALARLAKAFSAY